MAKKASKKKAASKPSVVIPIGTQPLPPPPNETGRLLTPSQVAEICYISTRTLARWALAFNTSLSETASRKGRKRFFTSADVEVIRKAQEYIDDGMSITDAAVVLPIYDPEEEKGTALVLSPEAAYKLGELVTQTETMSNEITRLRDENVRLEEKNDRVNERLYKLEAQARWQRQPFWKRLFTPPEE